MFVRTSLFALLLAFTVALAPRAHPTQDAAAGGAQAVSPEKVLAEMDWLAGSWSGDMWGGRFHAHYSTPAGGKILSHSRLLHGQEESFYEFEVFEARERVVHLQPYPGGKKAGGFELKSHDAGERKAVFENPDKDYPTRIVYHRAADDELVITLSDPHGGSDKVEHFKLSR
jgi:hypothetical protein